ncbi:MAG TPA: KH domain-containing protein [Myxococcota bacterium]|nr:KH domain-containing protein [Myxococcota bacterium]
MAGIVDLVTMIAKSLVDQPDAVVVTELEGEQTRVYELRVAKDDMGKVIGKQGRTAKAIRTVVGAAAARDNKRAILEIVE